MKKKCISVLIALFIMATHAMAQNESYEEMYKRIFGSAPEIKWQEATVTTRYNKLIVNKLPAQIVLINNKIKILSIEFLSQLFPLVKKNELEKMEKKWKKDKYLTLKQLKEFNIKAEFNANHLSLEINLPFKIMKPITVDVSASNYYHKTTVYEGEKEPKSLSAYMNMSFFDTIHKSNPDKSKFTRSINLKNVVNYQGYLLQSNTFHNDLHNKLSFTSAHIEKKMQNQNIKFGSISSKALKYQSPYSLLGFSIEKDNEETNHINQTSKTITVNVKVSSTISVLINNQTVYEKFFNAGTYILKNFPFQQGYNYVSVHTQNINGKTKKLSSFTYFNDYRILTGKQDESSIYIGNPLAININNWDIDNSNTIAGISKKNKLNNKSALGYYFHTEKNHKIAGYEYNYAIHPGIISFENALQLSNRQKNGLSAGISLGSFNDNNISLPIKLSSWSIGGRYTSKYFDNENQASSSNSRLSFYVDSGYKINKKLNLRFGYNNSIIGNKKTNDQYNIRLSSSYLFRSSITYIWEKENFTPPEWTILYSASIPLPYNCGNLEYRKDINNKSEEISLSSDTSLRLYQDNDKYAEVLYNFTGDSELHLNYNNNVVELDSSNNDKTHTIKASYKQQRFIASTYYNKNLNKYNQYSHTYRFDTAIAYADGIFAMSKPITDSFIIVKTPKILQNKGISIRNSNVQLDSFGASVITETNSDSTNQLVFDTALLPLNINVKQNVFNLYLSEYSGRTIELEAYKSVIVIGKLINEENKPLQYTVGTLTNILTDKKINFFTNRKGKFQIPGITTGYYILSAGNSSYNNQKIHITENETGLFRIGKISLKSDKKRFQRVEGIKSQNEKPAFKNNQYIVMAASSTSRKLIDKIQSTLIEQGYSTEIISNTQDNKVVFRLYTGKYKNNTEAKNMVNKLKKDGINATIITE